MLIDAQLEILGRAIEVKPLTSTGLISFSVIFLNFVDMLKVLKQFGDLQSSSTL